MAILKIVLDAKTAKQVQKVCKSLHITMNKAVKVFFQTMAKKKKFPFKVITENGMTLEEEAQILKASAEAKRGINVTGPMEAEEFIAWLKKRV